ncbi:GNAT family N-acetyltransferase [Bradyrhizobium manausense]|uniref:GNAT family N-acetyltransferase n=1 Tax=Bradyrhizobium manausense TaxID=989370 RepID=UPI001BA77AF4|nr:GNAT family N-acetyltransferase [Bradyrhizobium manausense]
MLWEDERLVCHVGALIRDALTDSREVRVGGIGGVMTAPGSRERGFARAVLAAMRSYLVNDQQVAFSLLFCASNLHAFYGKLDWRLFAGTPLVEHRGVAMEFTLNPAMVQNWHLLGSRRREVGSARAALVSSPRSPRSAPGQQRRFDQRRGASTLPPTPRTSRRNALTEAKGQDRSRHKSPSSADDLPNQRSSHQKRHGAEANYPQNANVGTRLVEPHERGQA